MADGLGGGRTNGLIPPQDLDAEAAILSVVMIDPGALDRVAEFLRPEHFYSEAHRRIFEACMALRASGQPVDIVQVGSWLKTRERILQVGGMAYLTEVLNAAPAVTNVAAYGRTVHDKWRVRQVIATCQRIVAEGYCDFGEADEFIDYAEGAIYAVARDAPRKDAMQTMRDVVKEEFRKLDDRIKQGPGAVVGIPTGFDRVDRVLAGLHDSDLTIVAARPGMGKSALVLNVATNVANIPGEGDAYRYGVALFSLEMPKGQIATRAVCSAGGVDLRKVRANDITPSDWDRLVRGAMLVSRPEHFYVDDTGGISLTAVRSKCRRLDADLRRKKMRLGLVAVDYLQLMKAEGLGRNALREQEVGAISRGLKELAKELGVPVIALAQLNRAVEQRENKRPMISDLRESGAIEQDADNICFIYRDEYYNADSETKGAAELIVAKQRNGPTGTVLLGFDSTSTRFYNLQEDGYA